MENDDAFEILIKQGAKVKAGQPIAKIDLDKIKAAGDGLITMTIFASGFQQEVQLPCYNRNVQINEVVMDGEVS